LPYKQEIPAIETLIKTSVKHARDPLLDEKQFSPYKNSDQVDVIEGEGTIPSRIIEYITNLLQLQINLYNFHEQTKISILYY